MKKDYKLFIANRADEVREVVLFGSRHMPQINKVATVSGGDIIIYGVGSKPSYAELLQDFSGGVNILKMGVVTKVTYNTVNFHFQDLRGNHVRKPIPLWELDTYRYFPVYPYSVLTFDMSPNSHLTMYLQAHIIKNQNQ